jgi:hypothetical protein
MAKMRIIAIRAIVRAFPFSEASGTAKPATGPVGGNRLKQRAAIRAIAK